MRGLHLVVVDLHPLTGRDPQGIHGSIWAEISDEPYEAPADKPLTVAAYCSGLAKTAYVEPVAVGDVLPDAPLFLDTESYVRLPLEQAYQAAWDSLPEPWQKVLEG